MVTTNNANINKGHPKSKGIQTASAKGQVTIPVDIRKTLGIIAGTPIRFVERDGVVMLEKVNIKLSGLCGMATARKSASLEEMDQGIGDAVAERFGRANAGR